jgi:hypothetical protein
MIINKTLMTENYKTVLYSKYDILGHYETKWFDSDWPSFEKHLQSIKLDYYTPKQKYIVEHVDTDYYHPDFNYGFWLSNLISVFKTVDIPLHALLLFTNHFGIEQELNALASDPHDRPTVVNSFITTTHYTEHYQPVEVSPELIKYPAICMMGAGRTHRHVVFRFLEKNNLLETVAISVKNT